MPVSGADDSGRPFPITPTGDHRDPILSWPTEASGFDKDADGLPEPITPGDRVGGGILIEVDAPFD